jgi:hypothetical protein
VELNRALSNQGPHVLDHVFVMCSRGAPEADALLGHGLREGSGNTHPGQGTACRRFFFENAYLELLWVHDAAEAQNPTTLPTRLYERWSARASGASPFGVVLRSAGSAPTAPPFATWSYAAPYLPAGLGIDVAVGTQLDEPALFYFRLPRRAGDLAKEPTAHRAPLREVAAVSLGIPGSGPRTEALRAVESAGLASFPATDEHVLRIDFGREPRPSCADLRPDLPLVLRF